MKRATLLNQYRGEWIQESKILIKLHQVSNQATSRANIKRRNQDKLLYPLDFNVKYFDELS